MRKAQTVCLSLGLGVGVISNITSTLLSLDPIGSFIIVCHFPLCFRCRVTNMISYRPLLQRTVELYV